MRPNILSRVLVGLMSASMGFSQAPYTNNGSIGTKPKQEAPNWTFPELHGIPVEQWVGKRLLFQPNPTIDPSDKNTYYAWAAWTYDKNNPGIIYPPTNSHTNYDILQGKIGKVIAVAPDSFNQKWAVVELENIKDYTPTIWVQKEFMGTLSAVFLDEIDDARRVLQGKGFWLARRSLKTYDADTKTVSVVPIPKYSHCTIQEVVASWGSFSPIRLIVKTDGVVVGFVDVTIDDRERLDSLEMTLTKYDWKAHYASSPKAIWNAIENEKIVVGMTKEAVGLSWFGVHHVKTVASGDGPLEAWTFLQFEGVHEGTIYFKGDTVVNAEIIK